MSNYVPRSGAAKKKNNLVGRENELLHQLKNGADVEKAEKSAERVRDAQLGVVKALLNEVIPSRAEDEQNEKLRANLESKRDHWQNVSVGEIILIYRKDYGLPLDEVVEDWPDPQQVETTRSITWFPQIEEATIGLETTTRGDGSYDGHYSSLKESWLVMREGEATEFPSFDSVWQSLDATEESITKAIAEPEGDFFHLLFCGLGCGRPITDHIIWDGLEEVADYRDHEIENGVLSFFTWEHSEWGKLPKETKIVKISFDIADGSYTREFIALVPSETKTGSDGK